MCVIYYCKDLVSFSFATLGGVRSSIQNLSNVVGALLISGIFLGTSNASTVQPVVSVERTVFYR